MNAQLNKELMALCEKYPELRNSFVKFAAGEAVLVKDAVFNERTCDAGDLPDTIKGPSAKIGVRRSGVHGYGVFALSDIDAGELVEEAKLLRLELRRKHIHDPALLDRLWGNRKCDCEECKNHGPVNYIALGFGSFYNHSDDPNTSQALDFKAETLTIMAAKPIRAGEEIFVSYGKKYWLVREFWKQVKKTGRSKSIRTQKAND